MLGVQPRERVTRDMKVLKCQLFKHKKFSRISYLVNNFLDRIFTNVSRMREYDQFPDQTQGKKLDS